MKKLTVSFFLLSSICVQAHKLSLINIKCESKVNPSCVESSSPNLSWEIVSGERNVLQTAYQILVANDMALLNKNIGNVWDSKIVKSDVSITVAYMGKKLLAGGNYYWKVRVWDNHHNSSWWSNTAQWQMGLLTKEDWYGAKWIANRLMPSKDRIVPAIHGNGENTSAENNEVLPLLRKSFYLQKPVKRATLYICGLGHFEASVNGEKIGDHFLDPGWTNYDKQALYVSFDITSKLAPGKNAIGVMLGNGMYYIPHQRYRKITGAFGYPKMISLLQLTYQDGSAENIVSDDSWKTSPGPITFSSIYGGEDYDARLEESGWNKPNFADTDWRNALIVNGTQPKLAAQIAAPLKVMDTLTVKKITHPNDSTWVYDLGQNASGIPLINVAGKSGAVIKITPGELLDDNGFVNQQASGSPNYFLYTLKGEGVEEWQPKFTYYGFRYLQLTGAKPKQPGIAGDKPEITKILGLHTRNSADSIGYFKCSSVLFNKTYTLINWAIKSNLASVLTDCPHREKLGWLEEAHLMGNSIRYNFDVANLFNQEITNMRNAQRPNGLIPDIAPEYVIFDGGFVDSPEWGSTGVILPWYVYQWYGNKQVLIENYDMIKRYVNYLQSRAKNNIIDYGLGDWFDIGPNAPGEAQLTPKALTATAYYYYDLQILSQIAALLNKTGDENKYSNIAKAVKQTFNHAFFNQETNQYATGSQTANAIAVYMGLVNAENKTAVVNNIVTDLRMHNNAITAGDIGFRYLLKVLADEGRSDVIFEMNSRSDVPGYGYQLSHGATALTESWQAYRFVSNNHFMLGHLMEWFYSNLAGISQKANALGPKTIVIKPEPVSGIQFAESLFHSPYGIVASKWIKNKSSFKLDIEVPPNTYAEVYLPMKHKSDVYRNGKSIKTSAMRDSSGYLLQHIGSGKYQFLIKNITRGTR